MKSKMFNNFGYKLLSVVLAVVLWIVVMNISDSAVTKQINDIPVQQLNGEIFDDLDKIYEVSNGDTVDIIVKGRRSVVSKLTADDFIATADLSTMSVTGAVQIFVTPKSSSVKEAITITVVDNTMSLILESKVTAQFPIKIKTNGETREGYAVGESYASPNIITVEGPESSVAKITDVEVVVDVTNKTESFTENAEVILYDAYHEVISNSKISLSDTSVDVTVNIYPTKSVPITIEPTGKPAEGFSVAEVIYQPQTVELVGPEDELESMESIVIDDISVSGITEDLQTTINITKYLPEGVFAVGTDNEIVITVSVEQLEKKSFKPLINDIELEGKNDAYKYLVTLSDDFSVEVIGLSGDMEGITLGSLGLYVDCSELTLGDNENVVLLHSDLEGIEFKITGTISISVSGSKK